MTIKKINFAFTPKTCCKCGRTFIWEKYGRGVTIRNGDTSFKIDFPSCWDCRIK